MKRSQSDYKITLYCGEGDLLNEVRALNIDIKQIPLYTKESSSNQFITDNTPFFPAEIESISMYWYARRQKIFDRMIEEVDVLSTHYYLDNLLVSRTVSIPTLFRFPGIQHASIRWKTMAKFATPDIYLSNSEATTDRLYHWLNLEVDGTVRAGVDLTQFTPGVEQAFNCDEVAILFVGRLDDGKGLYDLLEAYAGLNDQARLYLVGGGTLEDDLRTEANSLGISNNVEFVGPVPHGEIHHYYAAADIFCLPSYHEGFPVVNMEALASGCALISTQLDAVEEQVEDGENALLVDPGDVDALNNALDHLVNNQEFRSDLATNGVKRAQAFGWEKQTKRMQYFYEQINR
jgi:glycosyltransferase involved in cell wall biosynthesis